MASMVSRLLVLLLTVRSMFKTQHQLALENLALRQQLAMLRQSVKRPRVSWFDRIFWVIFSPYVERWRTLLHSLHPDTVIRWHREGFRWYWRRKSRRLSPGRSPIDYNVRTLIRHWRAFLNNHAKDIVGIDFFSVPTATFRIVYVFIMLDHDRRPVRHFNVTAHPTAQWTAQQINEALPWDEAPRYLLRDRDSIYGDTFQRRVKNFGIEEVKTAPRSPWQNPFVERLIGSIRRECLDHVIVLNERHLRRIPRDYFHYYHTSRNHLSLDKDPPISRPVEAVDADKVIALPRVGGLHHRYMRLAA